MADPSSADGGRAADGLLAALEREGCARLPIPKRLTGDDLAAVLLGAARAVEEVATTRGDDCYVAAVPGSQVGQPRALLVWLIFTAAGVHALGDAERRALAL